MLRKTCLTVLIFITLLGWSNKAYSQHDNVKFERISLEQGLSQSTVFCILQDHKGFMWFGTGNGLNLYDGYTFTVFKHDPDDAGSLSGNTIWCIYEDQSHRLWIGTRDGGLCLMDRDIQKFKHFRHDPNEPNSLSNDGVWTIHESLEQPGILWLGTIRGGLNRFDTEKGTFDRFQHHPDDPQSLSSNTVRVIYESPHAPGVLWIGTTRGGLNKLVVPTTHDSARVSDKNEDFRFLHYRHDPDDPSSLGYHSVWSIQESSHEPGTFWIGTYGGGLNRFDPARGTFTRYQHDPDNPSSLSSDVVKFVYESPADPGVLWIGTVGGGLNKMILPDTNAATSGEKETSPFFIHYQHDANNPNSLSSNRVWSIYESAEQRGLLWIGTWGGGLNKLLRRKEEILHYKHKPGNPNSLGDNTVWSIYEDHSGALWIGTNKGLDKMERTEIGETGFTHFVHRTGNSDLGKQHSGDSLQNLRYGLSHNVVRSIFQSPHDPGVLWAGTWGGGLNKLIFPTPDNPPGQKEEVQIKFIHYRHDPDRPNSLSSNAVKVIHESRQEPGVLWIGTYDSGLNKFDTNKGIFTHYTSEAEKTEPTQNGWHQHLSHNGINAIHESLQEAGVLWIGTSGGGMNRFDPHRPGFIYYKQDPQNPNSLSNNVVNVIYESPNEPGILWIGTSAGGLNKFIMPDVWAEADNNRNTSNMTDSLINEDAPFSGHFVKYIEKDGLLSNSIYGILEDNRGNLWLSTNRGICQFNPGRIEDSTVKATKSYDRRDGIQSLEFNVGAYHKSRSGEMFFGGINGFNAFYPDSIQDNPHVPPIVITDFQIFNKSVPVGKQSSPVTQTRESAIHLEKSITNTTELTLSYKHNVFSFEFAALDYTAPEKNQYAYKLEGFREDWIDLGTHRFLTFTNLDPGEYILRVKGSNNDGVWNKKGTSLKIIITPPWWKTWWAYLLYIAVAITSLYSIRRYELNRIQLKNRLRMEHLEAEKLKELNQLKSRFFANISHEFRTPLTLIMGPIEDALSKITDQSVKRLLRTASDNGRRLLQLINQLLNLSTLEADRMELKANRGDLISFLRGIVDTFESVAAQRQITLSFQTDYDQLAAYFDKEKLEQVFYNLMSNAIKFIPLKSRGEISVTIEKTKVAALKKLPLNADCAQIKINDTGIGIPAAQLPFIFDRFYQVDRTSVPDPSTTDKASPNGRDPSGRIYMSGQEGTGIGLALAKEIVGLHYGQIRVNSEAGKGTEITVILPLGKEHLQDDEIVDEDEAAMEATAGEMSPSHSPPIPPEIVPEETQFSAQIGSSSDDATIILIVEDHPDMRSYIREQLVPDYEVMEASNGKAGIIKAGEAIPDLVISDVMMPGMDGYQLCQSLKKDEKTSHIPVILLTARTEEESKLTGLETGADDYLTKPFSSKELQVRVKNLIEQRRRLREKFSRQVVLKPGKIPISSREEQFLNRVKAVVETHLGDETFTVEAMGREVGMSRIQLYRKLRALTNLSAGEFMLRFRLQRAAELLKQDAGTVAEIAYAVGFNTPNYFAKSFRKQFGCSPSEYKSKYF